MTLLAALGSKIRTAKTPGLLLRMDLTVQCAACPSFFTAHGRQRFCSKVCASAGSRQVAFSAAVQKSSGTSEAAASRGLTKNATQVQINRWKNTLAKKGIPSVIIATHKSSKGLSTVHAGDGSIADIVRFLHNFSASGSSVGQGLLNVFIEAANDPDERVAQGVILTIANVVAAAALARSSAESEGGNGEEGDNTLPTQAAIHAKPAAASAVEGRSDSESDNDEGEDLSPTLAVELARATTTVMKPLQVVRGADPSAGKRKREAAATTAAAVTAPTTSPAIPAEDTLMRLSGLANEAGTLCWFIALCQALAACYWVLQAITRTLPSHHHVAAGDALVEGIQRCCNNRGVRPLDTRADFKFAVSQRDVTSLARAVLSKKMNHDPAKAIEKARAYPGASPAGDMLRTIPCDDVTWFTTPHARHCRDSKGRSWYRPAFEEATVKGTAHTPIFTVTPPMIAEVRAAPLAIDRGRLAQVSYFTDSIELMAMSDPGILARFLNASLRLPDHTSQCGYCETETHSSGRRRLGEPPNVLVVFVQKDPGVFEVPAPRALYLHNCGGTNPVKYDLAAVIHRTVGPDHFTTNVRTQSGKWLRCDDNSVFNAAGFGDPLTAHGFVYDKSH
jgi:hypothetical protein